MHLGLISRWMRRVLLGLENARHIRALPLVLLFLIHQGWKQALLMQPTRLPGTTYASTSSMADICEMEY